MLQPHPDWKANNLSGSEDPADTIGADGSMAYLGELGVSLDDASMFLALQVLQAEKIGELTKDRFVKSWKDVGYVIRPKSRCQIWE